MRLAKKLAAAGLFILALYILSCLGAFSFLGEKLREGAEEGRMRNVTVEVARESPEIAEAAPPPLPTPTPEAAPAMAEEPLRSVMETKWDEEILETTIQGGLSIKNATKYDVDAGQLISAGPDVILPSEGPQILIIHTHGSEAYTQAGLDHYESNDDHRTDNKEFNIVRIGDELTRLFEEAGLRVIHDREIYDYPSYTGSYSRSGAAVEEYLRQYPDIAVVFDIHRDALGANGVCYKTMAEEDGVCASQIMLLSGSDDSGLANPHWRSNLAFALYLQNAVSSRHPSLMRPVSLVRERYNLHLTTGSLIIEVGSSGNTLQEALAAIRLFADSAAPALLELQEG